MMNDLWIECDCGWEGGPEECTPVEVSDSTGDYPAEWGIECPDCGEEL